MKTTISFLLLASWLAAAPLAATKTPPAAKAVSGRAVDKGVAVDLSVDPVEPGATGLREGREAVFRFKISDTATGSPLSGTYPAAWMSFLPDARTTETKGCTEKVEELIAGGLLARPEVDLNVYHVLALNEDSTITVVDPHFGFGGTKLLALIELGGPGEDWALSKDRNRLFVSVPDANRVTVVDTATWKTTAEIEVGPRPSRVALQPDGAYLWVTLEDGVAALDTASLRVAARIPTGAGGHDLAVSGDNRFVYVSNAAGRTLSVIDVARLAKVTDVPLGAAPTSLAWSPLGRAAYVTSSEAGVVLAVDASGVLARVEAEPGLGQIRFAPGGRLAFLVNPRTNKIHVLDATSNRILQTSVLLEGPDQVTFSENLAYVRHRGSEIVLMIPLAETGQGGEAVAAADFPAGQRPLGLVKRPSPADSIVRAPGTPAVLVANPGDKAIYFYKEGMAAPMGSFQNYSREPRAVMVVDRSLKERAPGSYETVARLPVPGRYQVAFFLDSPRAVHCFPVTVTTDPEQAEKRARQKPAALESLVDTSRETRVGQAVPLRFRISDSRTRQPKDGLEDVVVQVYAPDVEGQWRQRARPVGKGVYEVEFTPRAAGHYQVVVESPSQNLPFHLSPRVMLRVVSQNAAPPSP